MEQKLQQPEIWAGIECTINRLASGYKDQLVYSNHYNRDDDIDAIADLGITTLRYPVLWEKHQPKKNGSIDFSWVASQLERLRQRNVKPIAGLLHHGSGPEYTNLLDPQFPELLASYAAKVATRFPWIDLYTPVNEPLTTARFSGLYGHWFPHEKNDVSFVKMLLNQLKATVLAMREIRRINPEAKLVQTEDLGKTYSTPLLQYQTKMENQRRYLTFDILCGQFTSDHPLYDNFMHLGIKPDELTFFIDNPCPPDIIGANYYCTSERFLDEDLSKYPQSRHGGNTLHEYADVEAVRVRFNEPHGFEVLMRELWDRYQLPVAVTEAHLHCSREGQMRWFLEIFESACKLKKEGMDVRAVTAWSVLGSYGWNKLLTSDEMEYERGTFDVSSGQRRPTAMANVLRELSQKGCYSGHAHHGQGWWNSESRYFDNSDSPEALESFASGCRPILIFGKTGTLGKAISKVCFQRSLNHKLIGREEADICNADQLETVIKKYDPWAIINAAGYVRVDEAESDSERCFAENATGAEILARACQNFDLQFVTFSSDLVFDGRKKDYYTEADAINPLNVYGQSKACAEKAVAAILPSALIIRTSAFFGPWDRYNFAHSVIKSIENGNVFEASSQIISPTYVPHLANAALDLLIDEESGIWHLTNNTAISWFEFAKEIAGKAGFDTNLICETDHSLPAPRPDFSAMQSRKGLLMPALSTAIEEFVSEVRILGSIENT